MGMHIDKKQDPPTLDEIVEMFEFLDINKTGMISSKDLVEHLKLCESLKEAKFDQSKFIGV